MFDERRAKLKGPDYFPRLRLSEAIETPLHHSPLSDDDYVQIVSFDGMSMAFAVRDMAWHHVAIGKLNGCSFALTLCIVCHMGSVIFPDLTGRTLTLSCGGLYNGMALVVDDETQSYWHHVTGEALWGPLTGGKLETTCSRLITKREALILYPEIKVALSRAVISKTIGGALSRYAIRGNMIMPPHFRATYGAIDKRLGAMQNGLGVYDDKEAVFFPLAASTPGKQTTQFGKKKLVLYRSEDKTPQASFEDGTAPAQLFSRWYGFSLIFPQSQVGVCM